MSSWHAIFRFEGKHSWEELNKLIAFDIGIDDPWFESEADYQEAVKDGFVIFDGHETIILADG